MKAEDIEMKLISISRRCWDDDRNIETRFYYCRYEIQRLLLEIKESK